MDANSIDRIVEISQDAARAEVVTLEAPEGDGIEARVLMVPEGITPHSIKPFLDEYLNAPERRKGTARLVDLDSFIAHVKRFADADSALFGVPHPTAPSLQAVIDYHRATAAGVPRFGEHRAFYAFPLSPEWQAWTAKNAQPFSQAEFAAFVEDRLVDVLDPSTAGESAQKLSQTIGCDFASPSKLLELSRGLEIRQGSRARQQVRLDSGETQILYQTEHQDESGAPLRVPGAFLIGVPVFRAGVPYQIPVRLRYRLREGTITWSYELYRADRAFDDAFDEACQRAAMETGLPLFKGTPES